MIDPLMGALYPFNGICSDDQPISDVVDLSFVSRPTFESAPDKCEEMHRLVDVGPSSGCCDVLYTEETEFSDAVFEYISHILLEEDIEEKTHMLQDSLELLSAEKSFYEVLGKRYPPSPEPSHTTFITDNYKHSNDSLVDSTRYTTTIGYRKNGSFADDCWVQNPSNYGTLNFERDISPVAFQPNRASSAQMLDLCGESQFVQQFRMGVEISSKFLPNQETTEVLSPKPNGKIDKADGLGALKRKDSLHREEGNMEERSSKQAFVHEESILRSETFDNILLSSRQGEGLESFLSLRASLKNGVNEITHKIEEPKGSKGRGKKKRGKMEVVDVRTLLIRCAQAVSINDHRGSSALLNEIRKHASPFGNGTQRLAHYFADGLEARLAGTGSQIYRGLVNKKTTAADMLKAYQLYLAACPFQRTSNFVSNKIILETAADKMRIHVIDFGILYGFQWPTLIQHLALRACPPKLRITGIDLPQPGFRPAERIEETGRRLANYAETFKVPFEYNAIAKRWEFIKLEELKIDRDEVTIVNCMYRFKNLFDETITEESSRDIVLNLIATAQPELFIHGVINGTHNAPFFLTRFREALHHFSSLFDMLDTIIPRENSERMLIEKDMLGREALNSIACEGWERVERPETYKQWQLRNMRAGFGQVPLSRKIMRFAINQIVSSYHKDFVVDEVGKWLLLGWKGRFLYAISTWKPASRD